MKKSIFAVSVASVAGAMLPVVGVFAVTGTTVTDTVQVTINTACSITYTQASPSATMSNSQIKSDFGGTAMSISCNNAGGWKLNAKGSGDDASVKTSMNATGSGTDIVTGTATSGATSNWAFKVAGTGAVAAYTSFAAIPSTDTKVAAGSGAVSGNVITPTYQVWISATQQADTYTGKVTYTLVNPNS